MKLERLANGGSITHWNALNTSLHHHLSAYQGDALVEIPRLCKKHSIKVVCWNQTYEPWRVKQDQKLQEILKKQG